METQDEDLSDRVFSNMNMPDPAERRKFLKICRESYDLKIKMNRRGEHGGLPSNYVCFGDWKVFVSLLLQMEFVNLYGDNVCHELTSHTTLGTEGGSFDYSSDEDGRISILHLAPRNLCDLPAGIRQLDYLQRLCIFSQNFNSLPVEELSSLPHFQSMYLGGCSDRLSDSFLSQASVQFPHLMSLSLCRPPSFRMLHVCSALEHIAVFFTDDSDIDGILETLQSYDFSFARTLRSIEFTSGRCQMKDHQVETFLFDVLPRFPNVQNLEFLGSTLDIRSFIAVGDRISRGKIPVPSNKSVQSVQLYGQYEMEDLNDINCNTHIKDGLLAFLKTFVAVERVYLPKGIDMHPEWEYALIANMVGHGILQGSAFRGKGNGGSILPLTLWPEILYRSQQKCDKQFLCEYCRMRTKATGVYYLLRNGPAIIGRSNLVADSADCLSLPPSKRRRQKK